MDVKNKECKEQRTKEQKSEEQTMTFGPLFCSLFSVLGGDDALYHLGEIPHKRHTQFLTGRFAVQRTARAIEGASSGVESIMHHHYLPTAIVQVGGSGPATIA